MKGNRSMPAKAVLVAVAFIAVIAPAVFGQGASAVTPAAVTERARPWTPETQAIDWSNGVAYTYDGSGNIQQIGTDTFAYDAAGRLVKGMTNGSTRTYTYDQFGNRTNCSESSTGDCQNGVTVDAATNRLKAPQALYDGSGNVTSLNGHTYVYDAFNMQTRDTGGVYAREYVYTADDERLAVRTVGVGWRWTVRDTSGKVLREFASNDAATGGWQWTKDYVYRDGLLLASRQTESGSATPTTYHYHLDHLGTPRRVTDDADRIIGSHDYHPFGPELSGALNEPALALTKYTGHERDIVGYEWIDTLDYMHARYYSPYGGRFLSVDPTWASADLGKPQSWNRYAYVTNNPMNMTDPDGRVGAAAAGGGLIAGGVVGLRLCAMSPGCVRSLVAAGTALHNVYQEMKDGTPDDGADAGSAEESSDANGQFSVADWSGYPEGAPKPEGPFRIRRGEEYKQARKAANNANRAMHKKNPELKGQEIHEVKPVKVGGSPTNPENKVPLSPAQHRQFNTWWQRLVNSIEKVLE